MDLDVGGGRGAVGGQVLHDRDIAAPRVTVRGWEVVSRVDAWGWGSGWGLDVGVGLGVGVRLGSGGTREQAQHEVGSGAGRSGVKGFKG